MTIQIKGIPTEDARHLQRSGVDANGQLPEALISDGNGNPCRHCLEMIAEGEELLVFSYKPFSSDQPYAERGPAFLHKRECSSTEANNELPDILWASDTYIVRGYSDQEKIVSGTGQVVPKQKITAYAANLFHNNQVEFVHVRSSSNNCYLARIEKT